MAARRQRGASKDPRTALASTCLSEGARQGVRSREFLEKQRTGPSVSEPAEGRPLALQLVVRFGMLVKSVRWPLVMAVRANRSAVLVFDPKLLGVTQ